MTPFVFTPLNPVQVSSYHLLVRSFRFMLSSEGS